MPALSPERQQALQTLSAELARMTAQDGPDAALLEAVLHRLVDATEATGGAFWIVTGREGQAFFMKLAAAADLEMAAGTEGSDQRDQVHKAAQETLLSNQPLVLMPTPANAGPVTPGVLVNLGSMAIVSSPVRSGDDRLGCLQLWFPPERDARKLAELALLVQALMSDWGPRLRSRQLRELGAHQQKQQRLLQVAGDLTGVLESDVCARLAAAHIRETLGINRASLWLHEAGRWRVLAISGAEAVDARSRLVVAMHRFVSQNAKDVPWVGAVAENGAPLMEDNQMQSAALLPLRNGPEGRILGSLLCESVAPAAFGPPGLSGDNRAPALVLAQWLADLSGKAIHAALVHEALPFAKSFSRLVRWRIENPAASRHARLMKLALLSLLIAMACLWPVRVRVEADCQILPQKRAHITAEAPGRVEQVMVREGDQVNEGQEIARLNTERLASDLNAATQTRLRLEAEAARQRGLGKEALARIAELDAQAQAAMEKRLQMEMQLAHLRSPLAGRVMTKDVHLKTGTFLQAGELLAEVASLSPWDLRLEVAEADIHLVEEALDAYGRLSVDYLLYTQSARPLQAEITARQQISPALQPGEKGGVFGITLAEVTLPEDVAQLMRPGLTGRAKIELGRQPAATELLRKFTRWLRMRWWL